MDDLVFYTIFGFVFVGVSCMFLFAYDSHQYWLRYGFEQIQPHLFYGNLKPYLYHNQDFGTLLRNCYNESNALKYVGLYMMHKPALLLRDPQTIQQFMQNDFVHFNSRHLYSRKEKCPLLDNLYQRSGMIWRKERNLLAPAFTVENIGDLYDTILVTKPLERYLDRLSDCATNDIGIHKLMAKHLYNVMAWVIYGVHVDTISYAEESFRMTALEVFRPKMLDKILFLRNFVVPYKWECWLNFRQHSKKVEAFYISLTKHSLERRELHSKEWNIHKDYMQYLMKVRNRGYLVKDERAEEIQIDTGEAGKYLSLTQVSSQAFLAFTSGFPTILTTFDFFLYEIAKNQNIQIKLLVEIENMFAHCDGSPEYSDVAKMSYLDCCVNETLRKYPPIPYLVRYCTKDYPMRRENYLIEKGMPIFISVFGIHHDPKYYPDPLKFDPDRFSVETIMNRPLHTFLPFGDGPKRCLGMELAKAILKIHIVFLLYKYLISLGPKMNDRDINFDVGYLNEAKRIKLCFEQRMKLSPSDDDN